MYKIHDAYGEDDLKETYGEVDRDNLTVWAFEDAHPLVGLYGR